MDSSCYPLLVDSSVVLVDSSILLPEDQGALALERDLASVERFPASRISRGIRAEVEVGHQGLEHELI